MQLPDLFQAIHNPIKYDDLIPFTQENYNIYKEKLGIFESFETIKQIIEGYELAISNLFMVQNRFYRFWYIGDFAHIEIMSLDQQSFEFVQLSERIKKTEDSMKKMWESGEYEHFFVLLPSQFQFDFFMKHLYDLPKEYVYSLFRTIYVHNEYGFNDLDKEKLRYILSLNNRRDSIKKLKIDTDGYVKIYRGMTDASTPIEEAYSWTTSLETAFFFATRFDMFSAKVYQARIHKDKIIDYISNRGENEVLLYPEDVIDARNMNYLSITSNEFKTPHFKKQINSYNFLKTRVLDENWFKSPNGIHGLLHTKRVMFLCMMVSYLEELPEDDYRVLMYSAILHDIGRTDDSCDDRHGAKSIAKIKKLHLLETVPLPNEDVKVIKSIIKNHAIDDENGYENIMKDSSIKRKSRAKKLYSLFKDCDGLDRVRLTRKGDLDVRYIRNAVAKRLPIIAYQLLKYLK